VRNAGGVQFTLVNKLCVYVVPIPCNDHIEKMQVVGVQGSQSRPHTFNTGADLVKFEVPLQVELVQNTSCVSCRVGVGVGVVGVGVGVDELHVVFMEI
jgi:hypothetical protein